MSNWSLKKFEIIKHTHTFEITLRQQQKNQQNEKIKKKKPCC